MKMRYSFYCLFFLWVVHSPPAWTQVPDWEKTVTEVVTRRDTSYAGLRQAMKALSNDTTAIRRLISMSESASYPEGINYGNDLLGIHYRNTSNYPQAIALHRKALEAAAKSPNIDFKVASLNMLGVAYRRMDEVRPALDYHKAALELAEGSGKQTETNLRNIAISYNSIGNIYLTLKQYDLAAEQFQRALVIEKKVGNKLGLAINYQNLGGIYEEKREFDKSLESYLTSLKYNQEINSDLGQMICNNSIAQILLKQNKPRAALEMVLPTIKTAEELKDDFYIAWSSKNIGWAFLELHNLPEAKKYLEQCIAVAKKNNLKSHLAEAYGHLAEVYELDGNYQQALHYTRLKKEYEEQFLNEKNQQYIADLILKYDSEKKKNRIELLEKENEIVTIKLSQNRKLFGIALLLLSLIGIAFYGLYQQYKLKNERKLLEVEQKMMRSQMNPHFIFNSLNSIKLYIINNEKDNAVYYLNKFSKLIRTILANSKEKEISLADELVTMELYLSIENIRFANNINYCVTVEPGIDVDYIKVPSLILQPFLENAIWHGLSAKEGDKNLTLKVKQSDENKVQIEITDNGIGRKRSGEIKARKTLNQRSIGIELTTERLDNYFRDKRNKTPHLISFEDLYDEQQNPAGTRVILEIPIE